MITINLLPKEYEKKETTSPTNFIIRGACVLVVAIFFLAYLVSHFYFLYNTLAKKEELKTSVAGLVPKEQEHQEMLALIGQFQKRDETVSAIRSLRISFSKKMLEFSDILHQDNFPIWLNSFTIAPTRPKPGAPVSNTINTSFDWKGACVCASPTLQKATQFYEKIKQDPKFFVDFSAITIIPEFAMVDFGKEYQPSFGWNFNLSMVMESQLPEQQKDFRFIPKDFLKPREIMLRLKRTDDPAIKHLYDMFIPSFKEILEAYNPPEWDVTSPDPEPLPSAEMQEILAGQLSLLLTESKLYNKELLEKNLRKETKTFFAQNPMGDDLILANRMLLEDMFLVEIICKTKKPVK